MSSEEKLQAIRTRIDALDEELQALINERASLAQEVARVKLADGEEALFYRPEREAQVLRRVKERNQGPLPAEEVARLFREVMSACLALEQPMQIAFLGPEGTFSQEAVLKHFGHSALTLPMAAIDEVFREVEAGSANYGVVPVENSTEGAINHTLDLLLKTPLKICGEVELRIHDHLMTQVDSLAEIKCVYSHAQSLAQCREWLDAHLAGVERVSVSSNAEAARLARDEAGAAAIAGYSAAELYDLKILESNIEDDPNNTTRFFILGRDDVPASGKDKTALLVSTKNKPGALSQLLEPLARHGISMTRIESRPSRKGVWEYVFFVEIEGHQDEEQVASALGALEREAAMYKILGSFPRAVL
ncbi:chorismate mutase [Solemya pervernicosa gill symbiont]|uniref:Bifunctional chorismate mutase/prephenate dehydratase n=2 Tax=Gammaproteobacteria incertae sedis TaxID=118884 RepID=A0A1T2L3Q1_9GAMM|nr:prephenate dehydratase [Candidatus Reidiella endopervernicosa]OOZ39727.1 chorismate mutase [Solemya pervernicosa gill symbiont]QKQ26652.1 prephenate dehydratase [Candidatus Reidiella endopervernicosa]